MEPGFDVSPDGRSIAMAINAMPPPYRERTNLDVYVIATDGSGAMRDLTACNPFTTTRPRFSPDGRSLYYLRDARHNAGNRRIARIDLASGASATLTDAYDRSFDAIAFRRRRPDALRDSPRIGASSRSSASPRTGRG